MILDAAETVLKFLGFDRTAYGTQNKEKQKLEIIEKEMV